MKREMSRRGFLRSIPLYGFGAYSILGSLSCGSNESNQADTASQPKMEKPESDPCSDLTGLAEADLNIRKTFEYAAKSPVPEKVCDNCQFWVVPEAGAQCGGCQIIKGPINPKGYCKQWVAKSA